MLKQRTPLKRGKSQLKRTPFKSKSPASKVHTERAIKSITVSDPSKFRLPSRVDGSPIVIAVEPRRENSALRDFAKGQPCMLQVPGHCNHNKATTVGCHSNWAEHGKGERRKADDHYMVWGCSGCHSWLDQLGASKEEKKSAFNAALVRQVAEYKKSLSCKNLPARFSLAIKWALLQLNIDKRLDELEEMAVEAGLLAPMHLPESFRSPFPAHKTST